MKIIRCFSVVLVVSTLMRPSNASMVKRGFHNVVEVTNDFNKILADGFMTVTYPLVQFFAFDSRDFDGGSAEMSAASDGLDFVYFLSYNCADMPQYCPSDITQTTYRFYKNAQLKETREGELLVPWQILQIVENL